MNIASIIKTLNLSPHPEGGYYSETYRSEITLKENNRQLMTVIYFLLTSDNISRFHRIKSDELWFYHSGSPLIVHTLNENGYKENKIGFDFKNEYLPQFLVPKDTIFAASVLEKNSYSLVSCVVSPGFDFNDFELFTFDKLAMDYPDYKDIIQKFT